MRVKVSEINENDQYKTLIYHQVILAGTLTGVKGDIRCKVLAALSRSETGLIEGCNRKKWSTCSCHLFIEMKYTLVRFPTNVIGSSLTEIVKIEKQGSPIKMM